MELVGNDACYKNVDILGNLPSRKRRAAFWFDAEMGNIS